jgi:hypothetical protein
MDTSEFLAKKAILLLQTYIEQLGFKPQIHFELEGCFRQPYANKTIEINYERINSQLRALNIDGELVPEYWKNQWEYVSLFNGQSPFKEAENLTLAIKKIPQLLSLQGIDKTLIQPVIWSGDKGKLALGCDNIFTIDNRTVHIPNAIQMNISAVNSLGENILAEDGFGETLQQCFLQTSLNCCLLYLPEEDAFERLELKSRYGLSNELCSPVDISGGHQGSVALYKKIGKHNQIMGEQPLLYDKYNKVISSNIDWRKTARIEHRLGASSLQYNAYINVVYGLLNLVDALEMNQQKKVAQKLDENSQSVPLPRSLYDQVSGRGAITLFTECQWFNKSVNRIQKFVSKKYDANFSDPEGLGDKLKGCILSQYQHQKLIIPVN